MKKIIICLLVCVSIMGNALMLHAESERVTIPENQLFSQGAVLMDAATGRVLYGKNADMQLAMASTTKIMTCIVALEQGNMEDIVTASAHAAAQPKVKLYLAKGEQVRLKDLLYSLMLESHNDSAVAIAEHIGAGMLGWDCDAESVAKRSGEQSREAVAAFIKLMNEKARELQCYQTWFITPNGLDATETFETRDGEGVEKFHSTTAAELARMMSYCILQSPKKEEFLEITGTYMHSFSNVECTRSFVCRNHNAFLNMMEGALSGKTGYTGRAGYCYVGALERDGRFFVVALLNSGAYGGSNKTRKWQDTRKLMEYGLNHYENRMIYDGNTLTEPVEVLGAKQNPESYFSRAFIPTEVADSRELWMLLAAWEEPRVVVWQEGLLQAPVDKNQTIGRVDVMLEDELIHRFDIVSTEKIAPKTFHDTAAFVVHLFFLQISPK